MLTCFDIGNEVKIINKLVSYSRANICYMHACIGNKLFSKRDEMTILTKGTSDSTQRNHDEIRK